MGISTIHHLMLLMVKLKWIIAKLLLAAGADVNATETDGGTPLMQASEEGQVEDLQGPIAQEDVPNILGLA